jgi:D-amino-acid oxidase
VSKNAQPRVVVVGAGVIGLTSAVRLAEAGHRVQVVARETLSGTRSANAGAIWGPYVINDSRVVRWSLCSYEEFSVLEQDQRSGVSMLPGAEASMAPAEPPPWVPGLQDFRLVGAAELPAGYVAGWHYLAPAIDMPAFLEYLTDSLSRLGVGIEVLRSPLRTMDELASLSPVVVNCTGYGAKSLVPDDELYPVRGQLLETENPGIADTWFSDYPESQTPTYFIAHRGHVIMGGTIDPHATDLTPDLGVAEKLRERCAVAEPKLRTAAFRRHRVDLRPSRPSVRLERVVHGGTTVVHNYGHGGSGVTLSWGCADDVVEVLG